MSTSRIVVFLLATLVASPGVLATGQISGFVRNESGAGLANITVSLAGTDQSGADQLETQLTDAFGRYQFSFVPGGSYQLIFEDENFIYYTDEDPYPDEGSVYAAYSLPDTIALQENQNRVVSDVALQKVDSSDNRQGSSTVTNCGSFGNGQAPGTLSFALENAREIMIDCTGTVSVPEIVISRDVKITAASGVTLEAEGVNRILRILPGVSFEISGVNITKGRFNTGSAVYNTGITTIINADITGHTGDTSVLLNLGVLNLQQTRQYGNAMLYDSVFRNSGVISGRDITIESHTATGGPVISNTGRVELERCSISGLGTNNVFSVENRAGSQFKLFNCTITDSGSVFLNKGTLEIFDSSLDNNKGDQSLIDSTGVLKIGGTGITNNEVSGLVVYSAGQAEILNSTISSNRAGFALPGNASNADDYRGAVANEGLMQISSSTVASNIHPGFTDRQIGNAGELRLSNTIVLGTVNGDECGGVSLITSQGHNLHTDGTCGSALQSDIPFGNPSLLALAANGGLGKTHALKTESDALDAGNCNNGSTSKDQRGVARPQGNGCDIGAFELTVSGSNTEGNENSSTNPDGDTGTDSGSNSGSSGSGSDSNSVGSTDTDDGSTTDMENTGTTVTDSGNSETDLSDDSLVDNNQTSGGGAVGINLAQLVFLLVFSARKRCKLVSSSIMHKNSIL